MSAPNKCNCSSRSNRSWKPRSHWYWARSTAGLGENERAIALLQRALEFAPIREQDRISHADTLALLARAQYETGDYLAAIRSSAEASVEHHAQGISESA